jgi:hypothetical protein
VLDYLLVAGIVYAVNLLPAFGPPTSAVLVVLTLTFDLASAPLIAAGAIAAASGRFVLATTTRRLRPRLSAERRRHLATAEEALLDRPAKSIVALGLLTLSPVAVPTASAATNVHTATLKGSAAFPAVNGKAKFQRDDGVRELEARSRTRRRSSASG